jgi:hypothetical protein
MHRPTFLAAVASRNTLHLNAQGSHHNTVTILAHDSNRRRISEFSRVGMDLRLPEVDNIDEGSRRPRRDAGGHLHEDVGG